MNLFTVSLNIIYIVETMFAFLSLTYVKAIKTKEKKEQLNLCWKQ